MSSVEAPISFQLPGPVIEELAARIAPMVAELLRAEATDAESEFLTTMEVAQLMRTTAGRVRNLRTCGQLVPDAYNGRNPLYSRLQVRALMRTVDTLTPAEQLRRRA